MLHLPLLQHSLALRFQPCHIFVSVHRSRRGLFSNGRLKVNVAPFPSVFSSVLMLPPCASRIFLEMNNPIPVPPEEFVTNLENSFGLISGLIPGPLSLIIILAWLSFFSALIV